MTLVNNFSAIEIAGQDLPDDTYMTLVALQRKTSITDAITAPTVAQVSRLTGEGKTVKVICAVLKLFNDSLNTSLQMSARQLFEWAQIFIETYPHESVKDLIVCLKYAKAGKFGPIFNRVDGSVIGEFFRLYLEEKAEHREVMHRKVKSELIETAPATLAAMPEDQQKALRLMMQQAHIKSTGPAPQFNEREWLEWIKTAVGLIDLDTLTSAMKRAKSNNAAEAYDILNKEFMKRMQARQTDFKQSINE